MRKRTNKIIYNGVKYNNMQELADAYNISINTLRGRIYTKGMSLDEAINYNRYSVVAFGKTYKNGLAGVAKEFGIGYSKLYLRVSKGMTIEEAVKADLSMRNAIEFEGKLYKSRAHLARAFGIRPDTLHFRLKQGYSLKDAIYKNKQAENWKINYNGIEYDSLVDLANKLDININSIKNRLKGKERTEENIRKAVDDALEYKNNTRVINVFDEEYKSIYEAGRAYGLKRSTIDSRKKAVDSDLEILGLMGRYLKQRVGETIKNIRIDKYLYKGRDGLDYYSCYDIKTNKYIILNDKNIYTYICK